MIYSQGESLNLTYPEFNQGNSEIQPKYYGQTPTCFKSNLVILTTA